MMTKGFIMPDGEHVEQGGVRHDAIVLEYLVKHPELRKRYDQIGGGSLCDFMVVTLGALKVGSNIGDNRVITYKIKRKMSREIVFYVEYYTQKGYRVDIIPWANK